MPSLRDLFLNALLLIDITEALPVLRRDFDASGIALDDAVKLAIQHGGLFNEASVNARPALFPQAQVPWINYRTLEAEEPSDPVSLPRTESDQYTTFIRFSSAAYCSPWLVKDRTCGADCAESKNFEVVAQGTSSCDVPLWYVGWDPRNLAVSGSPVGTQGTIIVVHQGTSSRGSINQLFRSDQVTLNSTLFPNADESVRVHEGFGFTHQQSADRIFDAVLSLIKSKGTQHVITTGHSLGAAVALLDAISLQDRFDSLGKIVTVSSITFAMPRPGNVPFANYAEKAVGFIRHVSNGKDAVPVVLGMDYLTSSQEQVHYRNVRGELHIDAPASDIWYSCPGLDNPAVVCAVGASRIGNNATDSQRNDAFSQALSSDPTSNGVFQYHGGPYNGIRMGGDCTAPEPLFPLCSLF